MGFTLDSFKTGFALQPVETCPLPLPVSISLARYGSLTQFWKIAVGIQGTSAKLLKLSRVVSV